MFFPQIERVRAANDAKGDRQDCATGVYCDLLSWFRIVVPQDAVFLRLKYPQMPVWREHPFTHPLFENFATRLLDECKNGHEAQYVQVTRAMPVLASQLHAQYQNTMNTQATYHQSILTHNQQNHEQTRKSILDELLPISLFFRSLFDSGVTLPHMHLQLGLIPSESQASGSPSALVSNTFPALGARIAAPAATTLATTTATTTAGVTAAVHQNDGENQVVEQYRLAPYVKTVVQLWEEYDQGLPPRIGMPRGPSIRQLDEQFGVRWRQKDDYRKAYSRRRQIWEAVLRASRNLEMPLASVAERVDRWRMNENHSLNRLNSLLWESCKNRTNPPDSGLWGERDVELLISLSLLVYY